VAAGSLTATSLLSGDNKTTNRKVITRQETGKDQATPTAGGILVAAGSLTANCRPPCPTRLQTLSVPHKPILNSHYFHAPPHATLATNIPANKNVDSKNIHPLSSI